MNSTKYQDTKLSRNQLHFYVNNKLTEREIKKTIPATIASKRIKYPGINLTKDVKDLYVENYKTLKKKIEDTKKMEAHTVLMDWKNSHH